MGWGWGVLLGFSEFSESLGGVAGDSVDACACAGECGVDAVFGFVEFGVQVEVVGFLCEFVEGFAEEAADGVECGLDGFGDAGGPGLEALGAFLVLGGLFFVLAVVL